MAQTNQFLVLFACTLVIMLMRAVALGRCRGATVGDMVALSTRQDRQVEKCGPSCSSASSTVMASTSDGELVTMSAIRARRRRIANEVADGKLCAAFDRATLFEEQISDLNVISECKDDTIATLIALFVGDKNGDDGQRDVSLEACGTATSNFGAMSNHLGATM